MQRLGLATHQLQKKFNHRFYALRSVQQVISDDDRHGIEPPWIYEHEPYLDGTNWNTGGGSNLGSCMADVIQVTTELRREYVLND